MMKMPKELRDYRPILSGPTRYHGGKRRRLSVHTAEMSKAWNWLHYRMHRISREAAA